jgi:hypothetical protein
MASSGDSTSPPFTPAKGDPKTFSFFLMQKHHGESTRYIVQDSEGDIYWGIKTRSIDLLSQLSSAAISDIILSKLNAADFFPIFNRKTMSKYDPSASNEDEIFIKKQALLSTEDFLDKPRRYRDLAFREAMVAEKVAKEPHPNVCQYLGVVVHPKSNLVTGFAYKKYDCDLNTYFRNQHGSIGISRQQANLVKDSVRNAVKAIHDLGYVHCDVRPPNIFLRLCTEMPADHNEGKPAVQSIEQVVLGTSTLHSLKARERHSKCLVKGGGLRASKSVPKQVLTWTIMP